MLDNEPTGADGDETRGAVEQNPSNGDPGAHPAPAGSDHRARSH